MNTAYAIRVLVADDYEVLRQGLLVALRIFSDIEIVGTATNSTDVIEQCAALQPDVILMDIMMPGPGGVEATRTITANQPDVKIIALTSYADEHLVPDMIRAGAHGYLLKNISVRELADAIRSVFRGERVFGNEATQILVEAAHRPTTRNLHITPREREVLKLLVDGASNSEIAHTLVLSESTAKKHVSSILTKLGVVSRSEAVAFVLRNKLDLD